jgi:transposase-like protein
VQTTTSSINESNHSSTTTSARRVFTPEERQAILERYRSSGLTQEQFIAGQGISKASLGKWLQRERGTAKPRLQKPRFQEVLVPPARLPWQLEIISPQNWSMRFASVPPAQGLKELLGSLPC